MLHTTNDPAQIAGSIAEHEACDDVFGYEVARTYEQVLREIVSEPEEE